MAYRLHTAVCTYNLDLIHTFCEEGDDIEIKNVDNLTPLELACYLVTKSEAIQLLYECISKLLEYGALVSKHMLTEINEVIDIEESLFGDTKDFKDLVKIRNRLQEKYDYQHNPGFKREIINNNDDDDDM